MQYIMVNPIYNTESNALTNYPYGRGGLTLKLCHAQLSRPFKARVCEAWNGLARVACQVLAYAQGHYAVVVLA